MRRFKLQDPGEGIHEAEILEVRVQAGDEVQEGDIVLVVETDKASVDVPSPYAGTVDSVEVDTGDVVEVGATLIVFDGGQAESEAETERKRSSDRREQKRDEKRQQKRQQDQEQDRAPEEEQQEEREAESNQPERDALGSADGDGNEPTQASPATRRLAREQGVNLASVNGSGPGGRVLMDDVEKAARKPQAPEPSAATDETREKLRGVRRATARRMRRAWQEIPHVTHTVEADITDLVAFRDRTRGEYPHLTMTVVLLRALTAALRQHPRFNATLDEDEIVLKHRHHFGVAVDTDRGLLVPVIRDVDRMSMQQLAHELEEATNRARGGTLQAEEMRGGTFTLTNIGATGAVHFTPIINPPQAAILGAAEAQQRPVYCSEDTDGGEPKLRSRVLLPLILAFDHRLNDGMDAARFMNTLADMLAGPEALLAAL